MLNDTDYSKVIGVVHGDKVEPSEWIKEPAVKTWEQITGACDKGFTYFIDGNALKESGINIIYHSRSDSDIIESYFASNTKPSLRDRVLNIFHKLYRI